MQNYYERNKDKILKRSKERYKANRQKYLARMKLYREKDKERHNMRSKEWRKNNPEKYKAGMLKQKDNIRNWCKTELVKLKRIAIGKYSRNEFICQCCGEDIYEFLTIDHIHNDGFKDSKEFKSSRKWYKHIIDNNMFDRLIVACWNCNCGRDISRDKICPHKVK